MQRSNNAAPAPRHAPKQSHLITIRHRRSLKEPQLHAQLKVTIHAQSHPLQPQRLAWGCAQTPAQDGAWVCARGAGHAQAAAARHEGQGPAIAVRGGQGAGSSRLPERWRHGAEPLLDCSAGCQATSAHSQAADHGDHRQELLHCPADECQDFQPHAWPLCQTIDESC